MDYSKIYIELMERSFERELDGYVERHHVVPVCMGGDDKKRNIAILTPEEHFLAHQLLVKIYPKNRKLAYAASMMCMKSPDHQGGRNNNKLFGWLRRKLSTSRIGMKFSDETKKRLSESHKGKSLSPESRKKLSNSHKGKIRPKSHCDNLRGLKRSPETCQRLSDSHIGVKNPMFGKSGSLHHRSIEVHQFSKTGEYITKFESGNMASKSLGIDSHCISLCCRGKLKTSGGFIWKYHNKTT